MSIPDILWSGPPDAGLCVALAHGAGAPMDSPFMDFFADGLGRRGFRVARFEFPYMAARRADGKRRPPDREPVLLDTWRGVIAALADRPLVIGGKSMGGRMASYVADESGAIGLLCLGYPFTPPGKPPGHSDPKRTAHLADLRIPTLICQGERDPMGGRPFVEGLKLSPKVQVWWAEDGDHDLKPRRLSGRTHAQNLIAALDAAAGFLSALS